MTTKSHLHVVSLLALGFLSVAQSPQRATASTVLGAAQSFAVLGATTVTNAGQSTIIGDLGVFPGTSITGAGSISLAGTVDAGDAVAQQAATSAASAYRILASLPATHDLTGQNLGGLVLLPGVYRYATSAQLTGPLTLDFAGEANTDFVFQIGTSLATAAASSIVVENAGPTDGVFFQIGSSATLGAGSILAGNFLAAGSISFDGDAEIQNGRALALTGAVTMIATVIADQCTGIGCVSGGLSGGDLVGLGYTGGGFDGVPSSAMVSAVPLPPPMMLFGGGVAGLAGVGVFRRRIG